MTSAIQRSAFSSFNKRFDGETRIKELIRFIGKETYNQLPEIKGIADGIVISYEVIRKCSRGKGIDQQLNPFVICRVAYTNPATEADDYFGLVVAHNGGDWTLEQILIPEEDDSEDFFGFSDLPKERKDIPLPEDNAPLMLLKNLFENKYPCYRIDDDKAT